LFIAPEEETDQAFYCDKLSQTRILILQKFFGMGTFDYQVRTPIPMARGNQIGEFPRGKKKKKKKKLGLLTLWSGRGLEKPRRQNE
jgi:hypothetical protein